MISHTHTHTQTFADSPSLLAEAITCIREEADGTGRVESLGSTEGNSDQPKGCLHNCQEQRPGYCQCLYTVISKLERRGSPQRRPSQMAGNMRAWQPRKAGHMETGILLGCPAIQNPYSPSSPCLPHPTQVLMASLDLLAPCPQTGLVSSCPLAAPKETRSKRCQR